MDTARTGIFDVSPMTLAAGLAVIMLVGAFGWQFFSQKSISANNDQYTSADATNWTGADTSGDAIASIQQATQGPFGALGTSVLANAIVEYDKATKDGAGGDEGIAAVKKFAENLDPGVTYKTYATTDILTDANSSKDRVLAYRADMRFALEPLLANKDNELDLFAQYVETKDSQHLSALRATIANYEKAISNTEKVVAPADAASYHAAVLTALSQFSSTLAAMTENASDPIASAVLLKAYTLAQDNMLASFNAIGGYAARKIL